ncbi:aldehyde dehydrogenase [Sulfodiicoccus acidiphilus]|uniref:Aldehyde dehydrogenase n=1 Tax=Sulfodiicoccus acidiphilus TaxID=1670455 RepID=A0A348B235_9CREN|nr:aldehyde dehydrogenase family protein [Sulfodiicoccus acidiphilus]BBD72237.1 aldehyde dehydrogenase [Sulfodiicoccus acidiphilus]GGT90877.1 aldehyde dehydrogenase [Sulfodiicoccus acidiphilus]
MREQLLFIDGEWVTPESGRFGEKVNPSTGEVSGRFALATRKEADEAIDAAYAAQRKWEALTSVERSKYIYRLIQEIEKDRASLESLLIEEVGKPRKEAAQEVEGVIDQLQYYAEFARKITGDVVEGTKRERLILQLKVPYGVVLAITPWNFPAAMVARKVGPALVGGNTVVLKPSSDTPFTAGWLVEKARRAGFPAGVVNLATGKGSEIGDYLTSHKKVSLITLTGETGTGVQVMKSASSIMAKLILELGGKAPFIVWKDADLELAAKVLMWAKYWNAGQSCIAAERLYIHQDVYDRFLQLFLEKTRRLRLGPNGDMGPLINGQQLSKVNKFVEDTVTEGGKVLYGGRKPDSPGNGFFYMPTIISNVDQGMRIFREEVFGPVIGAMKVPDDFDQVIDLANDSDYGLASYLFTRDSALVLKAAQEIKFGELYTNMPGPEASQGYHTGFRMSGQAGENSRYGVEEYVKVKNVYLDYSKDPTSGEVIPPYS